MPPRLSLRRTFVCVLICGGIFFFVIQQKWSWLSTSSSSSSSSVLINVLSPSQGIINNNNNNNNKDGHNHHHNHYDNNHYLLTQLIRTTEKSVIYTTENTNVVDNDLPKKNWYLNGGTILPKKSYDSTRLLPDIINGGDRITEQLMYVPEDYEGYNTAEKVILAYNGLGQWGQKPGPYPFHSCPVNRCTLTDDKSRAVDADALIYKDHFIHPGVPRPNKQIWILYFLECPYHTQNVKFPDLFNWTATYRRDSDLVAPYERWTYYDDKIRQKQQNRDYALNKTKKVSWFVSNCGARNGRLAYARELGKHIQVDIYGTCGPLKCPRSDKKCFELLDKDYKFYLAFENSNCRDYITEKFYVNGLGQNVLPIVMGARPEDYERSAPDGSYIHVDEFASPAELAAYLYRLDKDDDLYNSYFRWKGTGEFINTYFWCRLCAMLHAPITINKHYDDVNEWWRGPGVCSSKSWRHTDT